MKNKIFGVAAGIILIGIIVVGILGFKVGYSYKGYDLVTVQIGQSFNEKDIKTITNEVFPNENIEIQSSGVYSDTLVLRVKEISQEQKETLSSKLNEKYGTGISADSIKDQYVPNFRLRDIAKMYVAPLLIATAIALVYIIIRFRKLGILKILAQYFVLTILAEALYLAIIAITRFPVNELVMPGAVAIYFALVAFLTNGYEKQLKAEKE